MMIINTLRRYLLKDMYDETEIACYVQLRLTTINFLNLYAILREKCGLCDNSVYVVMEEKIDMFLISHG
jgi:hypothetical protein